MASKIISVALVTDHLYTLHSAHAGGQRSLSLRDLAQHYGLPALAGIAIALAGARIWDAGEIIAGAAILAGIAFALAVFVFQLRIEASRDPRVNKGDYVLELLDELFANVNYLVLVGVALTSLTVAAVSFTHLSSGDSLNAIWTALITALCLHFVITLLMCLKRLRRSYEEFTL